MIDIAKLKEEQKRLANKVILNDSFKNPKTVAGTEQLFFEEKMISAISVLDYKSLKVIEEKYAISDVKVPYIHGFLFYREGPAILEAFGKLKNIPDVTMISGNGILHPRRLGIASQTGILLDSPTIGVAKKLILGKIKEKTIYSDKEALGYEIFTRNHAKPIYISPGHKITLSKSLEITKNMIKNPHKLPEPLHQAHKYAVKVKKELKK